MTSAFMMPANRTYLEGPPRQVPGFSSLHAMVTLLLAEHVSQEGRVLVLGAGGGLELRAMAEAQPGWQFVGVDPDPGMLALASKVCEPYRDRIALHEGRIEGAPLGPFDGAVSLLTFHFISREERKPTLRAIRQRLKPEAPFVLAHLSYPQDEPATPYRACVHSARIVSRICPLFGSSAPSWPRVLDDFSLNRDLGVCDQSGYHVGIAATGDPGR